MADTKKIPEPNLPKEHQFYAWKKQILDEIYCGGEQPPCPYCGVPRVSRIGYIRCSRCGINWIGNEALHKDPRSERLKKFIADTAASAPPKKAPATEEAAHAEPKVQRR